MKKTIIYAALLLLICVNAQAEVAQEQIYVQKNLKPVDSVLKVKVGEKAPDFTLPSISGKQVSLSDYRGKKNVVISFVPAAFTPICSDQWPGYNIARELFEMHDAELLGITTDNVPSPACMDQPDGRRRSLVPGTLGFLSPWGRSPKIRNPAPGRSQ